MPENNSAENNIKEKPDFLKQLAAAIVNLRYLIFLAFAVAAVYCFLSVGRVQINSDLTAFLPPDAETRRGLTVMDEEFVTYASAQVMVSNITYETAEALSEQIAEVDNVTEVVFDDTRAHYKDSAALFSVSFGGTVSDPDTEAAMAQVKAIVEKYDHYISSEVGNDFQEHLAQEMVGVLLIAAVVIMGVLLFTSRSYFEVVIFGIVFIFAALLNMGTNFWLGEISSITNSVAVILQLALAIDYSIIFAHRYQDEAAVMATERAALIEALAKSIAEIASSSLTTISGLVALTLMQFRLGYDLGVVLAKGIIFSMLTVFLLMPGLILLFPRAIKRTAHKKLIPNIEPWGRFLGRTRLAFVIIFAAMLPFAIYASNNVEYAFNDTSIDELVYSPERAAVHKINDSFDPSTTIAVIVPSGDFEKEKAILKECEALDAVKNATGLAGIKIDGEHHLTDRFNPRMFAELLDIDLERSRLLFQAYGVQHEEYQAVFGSTATYEVPLIDMFFYLFEKIDQGFVTLDADQAKTVDELRPTLERGAEQLRGENWDRLVLTSSLPAEGAESTALVETVRGIAEKYYGEGSVIVTGDITSARDLRDSYNSDALLISILTILFVYIILLFTFRSVVGAAVLVFVIQGCIWLNFSYLYITDTSCSFVTYMIESAIQMGATIDYAIVLMSRYLALRERYEKRDAMVRAVNEAFPTVLTSGAIMAVAGLLIAFRVSDVYVGHIGFAVGRGALISVVAVMTVLPQLLVLCDGLIEKTTFKVDIQSDLKRAIDPDGGGKAA